MSTMHDVGTTEPTLPPPSSLRAPVDPQRIAARVRREHAMIRTLLDDVERACVRAHGASPANPTRLRRAVWDLYLVFDEHLAMEEAHVAPFLRAFDVTGEQRAVDMILEHNEQRRVILELVEDVEREETAIAELVKGAISLVQAFRTDIEAEEAAMRVVFLGRL